MKVVRLTFILLLCEITCDYGLAQSTESIGLNVPRPAHLKIQRRPTGFTMSKCIGGEDVLLAYSDESSYDDAVKVPAFRRVVEVFDAQEEVSPTVLLTSALPDEVQPLCSDLWEQAAPYNILAPMIDSTHCYVGCVALNMAQVMRYYQYPGQGSGTHAYIDSLGCGDTLIADFSQHAYQWNYMIDSYKSAGYSERQLLAVAQLLSDCGIAVDMKYGIGSSAANSLKQPSALIDYFGYDRAIRIIYRDLYSHSDLHNLIRTELAEGRPVMCAAYGIDGGGHAFVIDGYDNHGLYHINWGWGGWCNGYYNIDYMTANQPEWGLFPDRQENGANLIQCFTIGVQPATMAVNTRESHELALSRLCYIGTTGDSQGISLVATNLRNVGWNDFKGRTVLALKKVEDVAPAAIVYEFDTNDIVVESSDTIVSDTINLHINSQLADGAYQLLPMYEDDGEWKCVRTSRGTPNYVVVNSDNGIVSCHNPEEAVGHLALSALQFPDTVVRRQTADFSITVTNESEYEFCGRFYVTYIKDQHTVSVLAGIGQYLQPGETHTVDFQYARMNIPTDEATIIVAYEPDMWGDTLVLFDERKDVVVVDSPTGIKDIRDSDDPAPAYDLSGRRVNIIHNNQIIISRDGKKRSFQNVP